MLINGTILCMDEKNSIFKNGCLVIEDENIIDIGKYGDLKNKYPGYEKINCEKKIILPPFINCHTHASMTLLRGYADDLPLNEWLTKWIFPVEKTLIDDDIFLGTQLAAIESALSGTSCLNTMYYFMEKEAEAITQVGLRGVVGHVCFSGTKKKDNAETNKLVSTWHNAKGGLIRVTIDPHSIYTVDPIYLQELYHLKKELNQKYGSENSPIQWHIHTAESSTELEVMRKNFSQSESSKIRNILNENHKSVFSYLNSIGVLDQDIIAAHCIYLDNNDISIIRKNDIKVVHNPVSNMKLASGISPLPKLIQNQIKIGLGTDGACSNNSLDMFETMKFAALLHKIATLDATVVPAKTVVRMATIDGAKVLAWDKEIGSLEKNKKADILILDKFYPHSTPLYDIYSHLAYAFKPINVDQLIVKGKHIVKDKKIITVDVEKIMDKANRWKEDHQNQ
jgi:5-methylthioadenosine/S-adenosylhomocysteine deaminase